MKLVRITRPFTLEFKSVFTTSATRYARSKGLWLLLLVGLAGARFWLPRDDGTSIVIAIDNHLPQLTSPMIGLSLGTVLCTLLLPFCFLYLRSNVTRRQPWQIVETTPASRVAISLGASCADSVVLVLLVGVLGMAGWLMAWFVLPSAQIHLWQIFLTLGLTAIPTVLNVAALCRITQAFPVFRRAFGDVFFFMFWLFSIASPLIAHSTRDTYRSDLWDFGGAIQPLSHFGSSLRSLNIGYGMSVLPGRVFVDALALMLTAPYIAARITLALAAIVLAALAGVAYRPQAARPHAYRSPRWTGWLRPRPAPAAAAGTTPSQTSKYPFLNLIRSQSQFILGSRLAVLLACLIALFGVVANYRHATSPLIMLLLLFGLTGQAAREEASGMTALTVTAPFAAWYRRTAFVAGGMVASILISLPALIKHPTVETLALAAAIGAGAALFTVAVTVLSRSAFAARLLLLLAWYAYLSAS